MVTAVHHGVHVGIEERGCSPRRALGLWEDCWTPKIGGWAAGTTAKPGVTVSLG
jgi:hypothetical protein